MSKGDWRRPTQEDEAVVTKHWCEVFGHKWSYDGMWCVSCGVTKLKSAEAT